MNIKKAVVCGAGGFIGSHLVDRLKKEKYYVIGIDLKKPDFEETNADEFYVGDLTDQIFVEKAIPYGEIDELYQLAADMGGAGYIFIGVNDANIMRNSMMMNLNVLTACVSKNRKVNKIFYSSSACVYPEHNQNDPDNPKCSEDTVYPAEPDSEYGWEKLFSERVYLAFKRNYNLNIHIGRYHNIYGPKGTYKGGKEKAPAALCRKIIECQNNGEIEIWGDGKQTRSFLHVNECVEGTIRLTRSNCEMPLNIGSEELISINDFAKLIISISQKNIKIKNIDGPLGVRGRTSDNRLIKQKLNWAPSMPLIDGIRNTYLWIKYQIEKNEQES